jgi:hypothetical protein
LPITAPSPEAFAIEGKIYVNARSTIVLAAVRSRAHDVVLASLLLHEQAHLLGANEQQALEAELDWLIAERAGNEFIRETRRAIEREKKKSGAPVAAGHCRHSPGPGRHSPKPPSTRLPALVT